jgi:hypothetical protein
MCVKLQKGYVGLIDNVGLQQMPRGKIYFEIKWYGEVGGQYNLPGVYGKGCHG